MKWPWPKGAKQEQEELVKAQEHLEEVRKQWPLVIAVSQTLRGHQERNHFADSLGKIFRGEGEA